MKIIPSTYKDITELPLKLTISFEAIYEFLETIQKDKSNLYNSVATTLLKKFNKIPILRDGFEDVENLYTYRNEIDQLLEILFPNLLQSNEIKAASIPFEFTSFKLSKRFESILENAPEDYELKLRNYDQSVLYVMSCTFILAFCYDTKLDVKRPFFFDIPDVKSGLMKHYRVLFNGDFFKVKPLENAPKLNDEDIKLLLDNFDNIEMWKEKFPPKSYEFRGFGLMNLIDVTSDELISNLKESLIKRDQEAIDKLEQNISRLFGSDNIKFEFSVFNTNHDNYSFKYQKKEKSYIMDDLEKMDCNSHFCEGIIQKVFKDHELLAISDIEKYGKSTDYNGVYKSLKKKGIQSIILVPLNLSDNLLGIMELVSPNKHELNSINANILKDIIPVFKVAANRFLEELDNRIESTIQEHYTSIHPTVKWKFSEAADEYISNIDQNKENTELKDIIFENVVPLYGQSDIKGSSIARNKSIQLDLIKQLDLAFGIINKAKNLFSLPIYDDLLFRIKEYQKEIKSGLNSGDEVTISYFLKTDIYPVFSHLKTLDPDLSIAIDDYMNHIDPKLHVIYEERKKYEESVNTLNEALTKFIDAKQEDAQKMFPHYFERYKTDGVDYNMYIGQSLVQNRKYNEVYLQNLRLWQLQMMCELENVANDTKSVIPHKLEVASLILVHSTPLAIKFRMDEKRFDVDGAYNIRYEIIKKRIDKAHIKNTNERLTQPGKIAIVYNQSFEAMEYMKYIKHLQSMNYLEKDVETVEIEDLQGTSGLKALRVSVIYHEKSKEKITLDDIMNVINDEN